MAKHLPNQLLGNEKREMSEWVALCDRIRTSTPIPIESAKVREGRIEKLHNDFTAFCKYYFPDFMDSEFGWFHLKAVRETLKNPNIQLVLEFPREHAKSMLADVFLSMFLYARGELSGLILVSANQDKAATLLGDLQAQFVANDRFIADYGSNAVQGDWNQYHFAVNTKERGTIGFWAYGRGQSPRGARKAANRPNLAIVDDIDDKVIVKNIQRVREAVDWVYEDLYGALSIKGARLIIAGNRIHKKGILAHIVGDTDVNQPKKDSITHIKVFALENKRHQKDLNGQPAWKERYTRQMILDRLAAVGHRSAMREYFHEHMEEGNVFRHEWIHWGPCPKPKDMEEIEVYCDPSFKDTKDNDYKAIVAVGKLKSRFYILRAWVRQASTNAMVRAMYDMFDTYGERARYRMEANFMQDMLLRDFDTEAEAQGYHVPMRADKRSKPDKYSRVENLSPLFERGFITLNEAERTTPDMQTLLDQFLAFPTGHDDAPDAVEGAIHYLNKGDRRTNTHTAMGKFTRNQKRML